MPRDFAPFKIALDLRFLYHPICNRKLLGSPICRLYGEGEESASRLLYECENLQKQRSVLKLSIVVDTNPFVITDTSLAAFASFCKDALGRAGKSPKKPDPGGKRKAEERGNLSKKRRPG